MRGKSAPRGASPARDDVGTITKKQVLADTVNASARSCGAVRYLLPASRLLQRQSHGGPARQQQEQ